MFVAQFNFVKKNIETVVITGASAGVGRAVAHEFAKHGANVALLARGVKSLQNAKKEVEALGGRALIIPTDVSDPVAVEAAAKQVENEFGSIDVWINNAMVSVFSPVKQMTAKEFRRVTEVNYLGVVHGTLSALRSMLPKNKGTIIQVGSALAKRSIPLQSAYCATKHAIKGFTESLRVELMHDKSKVHVGMVHLPAVNTPQFRWVKSRLPHKAQPVPPIFQPEVVARAIYWAAHSRRRTLYVGYPTWKAIVAEKFVPWVADWYLARTNYRAQQTSEPIEKNHRDNLMSPIPELASTHGDFDGRSRNFAATFWMSRYRNLLWGAAIAGGVAGFARARRHA